MLTGLKISSSGDSLYFYRPENNAKRRLNGIVFWRSWNSKNETQRVGEKNGVICLIIMFIARVMVIKMSKMVHSFFILLMIAKN